MIRKPVFHANQENLLHAGWVIGRALLKRNHSSTALKDLTQACTLPEAIDALGVLSSKAGRSFNDWVLLVLALDGPSWRRGVYLLMQGAVAGYSHK